MAQEDKIIFCTGGGCTAKLGAGVLSHILEKLPRGEPDPNLLVGYDSRDDAAVYRITDEIALVQTVDFFPPMVDDPYTFGQIAAANALSDVYAMGGEVKTALNLVCFPESMDLNILGEILRGGAEKVAEAGGILAGGHSIADTGVKYGLSVTGLVDPRRLTANDTGKPGDKLILTKALGVGPEITGVAVSRKDAGYEGRCAELANASLEWLGSETRVTAADFDVERGYFEPGYEQPNEAANEAIRLLARTEGLLTDPVYTGKALAGLIGHVREGRIAPGETVIFWHTGGATALFAEQAILGDLAKK